ncbi:hypothetical protein IW136_000108 [Coemansia sp. RSA 678]|nr:hypothetical protein IW136_000108 [Coemansia sp. RSA 678]
MKVSFVTCVAFAASVSALPSHHYPKVAPVSFANGLAASLVPLVPLNNVAEAKANRDARREDHRKAWQEWQEWAHQPGTNGIPNGTNFVVQVLEGVSGIVDSALGPLYSVLAPA